MESVKSQSYEVHINELAKAALNQHVGQKKYSESGFYAKEGREKNKSWW